jgi:Spy/CpxP family protein refolding chaperone
MFQRIHSKVLAAGMALALVAGLGVAVHGQGRRGDGPGFGHGFGPGDRGGFPLLRQLDLTDAQRQQVRDVMQRHSQQLQDAGKKLHEAHVAQRAAVETVPVNESLIRSTSQALANAQTDFALVQARVHADVWGLLTPDQQQKAKELKDQRATRQKERQQRRSERRQG